MKIFVLGMGCSNCKKLEENAIKAIESLKLNVVVEKISDFEKIAEMGVMQTPALVFDEKIVSQGKILSEKEIIELIKRQK